MVGEHEPDPPPVTTIAWRFGHVIVGVLGARLSSHFGGPPVDYQTATTPAALRRRAAVSPHRRQ